MNKYQLEIFLTVAQTKQISSAAKLMHLSQPAVSAQIKALETHCSTPLFERTKQGVELTRAGEIMLRHTYKILAAFDELDQEIDQYLNIDSQNLKIGATQTIGNYALPCSLWTFKQKYPNSKISLEIRSLQTITQQLLDGKLDIAIVEKVSDSLNDSYRLTEKIFSSDEALIIYPGNTEWKERFEKVTSITDLISMPFIMPSEGLGLLELFTKELEDKNLSVADFNIVSELGSIEAIKSSVQAGLGFSICSRMAIQKELRQGTICEANISDLKMPISITLLYRTDGFMSVLGKRFIQFITTPEELQFCG